MKNYQILVLLLISCVMAIIGKSLPSNGVEESGARNARGLLDWGFFSRSTTSVPETTTEAPKKPNDLVIGECEENDKVRGPKYSFK